MGKIGNYVLSLSENCFHFHSIQTLYAPNGHNLCFSFYFFHISVIYLLYRQVLFQKRPPHKDKLRRGQLNKVEGDGHRPQGIVGNPLNLTNFFINGIIRLIYADSAGPPKSVLRRHKVRIRSKTRGGFSINGQTYGRLR